VLDKNREISPFMEIDGRRLEAFAVYGYGGEWKRSSVSIKLLMRKF